MHLDLYFMLHLFFPSQVPHIDLRGVLVDYQMSKLMIELLLPSCFYRVKTSNLCSAYRSLRSFIFSCASRSWLLRLLILSVSCWFSRCNDETCSYNFILSSSSFLFVSSSPFIRDCNFSASFVVVPDAFGLTAWCWFCGGTGGSGLCPLLFPLPFSLSGVDVFFLCACGGVDGRFRTSSISFWSYIWYIVISVDTHCFKEGINTCTLVCFLYRFEKLDF